MATLLTSILSASASGATPFTSGAIDTTGAGLLVVFTAEYSVGLPAGGVITDSKGNTWTKCDVAVVNSNSVNLVAHMSVPSSVGSGHTFTNTAQYTAICVLAFDDGDLYPRHLAWKNGSGVGVTSLAATAAQGIVIGSIAALVGNVDTTVSLAAGYTMLHQTPVVAGQHMSLAVGYRIAADTHTPSFSWSGSEDVTIGVINIFDASGVGSGSGGGEHSGVFA